MKVGKLSIRRYACGHSETVVGVAPQDNDTLDVQSLDGHRPFKYQIEGGHFIEKSNGRCGLFDEMALGKTIQALIFLKAHPECLPALIIAKSGLRIQWSKESIGWGDFMPQIIEDTKTHLLKGMDMYIASLDSTWRIGYRNPTKEEKKAGKTEPVKCGETLEEQAIRCKVKTIIIDECQLIKNGSSKRTNAVRKLCANVEHIIALSGTPIKNNAAEYFPILNILRPDKFPSERQFIYGWCDTYFDGYKSKTGGLKNPKLFLEYTKDFILRRERKDVLPDLPAIFRQFSFCDLGEIVEDEYQKTLREFNDFYDDMSHMTPAAANGGILAFLSRMRHLTGIAKIDPTCEHVEEFITTTDRKLMIFVHHKDVGQIMKTKLDKMAKEWPAEWGKGILEITSEMSMQQRDEAIEKFRSPEYRIMIGSTLASGEGLNLQFCSDLIMMERQWNPANEEQAEARFPRPGQTADKINATYFVAVGTVDEFFAELVEKKREIVTETLAGRASKWDQSSLVMELAHILREKGGSKWGW
jgi:SNF2 family DNA or RNA helicase